MCDQGNVWHHLINQLQWKNITFFLIKCHFYHKSFSVCVHIYAHTHMHFHYVLLLVLKCSKRPIPHYSQSNKREQKAKQFPNGYFIRFFNIKFILVCNPKVTWSLLFVYVCVFTFIVYCFLNSLAQFSGGVRTATIHIRREILCCQFWAFKFLVCLGCGFFCCCCCEVCILYLQQFNFSSTSSNSRVFFFSPLPPLLHSQLNHVIKKRRLDEKIRMEALAIHQCFP